MPRVYELPTHLQVEDVLIAGLTARQLLRLTIGASLAYGLWDQAVWLPQEVRLSGAAVLAVAGAVFGLVQPGGRPLDQWLLAGLLFVMLPRRLVWRPGATLRRQPPREQAGWAELDLHPEWLGTEPDQPLEPLKPLSRRVLAFWEAAVMSQGETKPELAMDLAAEFRSAETYLPLARLFAAATLIVLGHATLVVLHSVAGPQGVLAQLLYGPIDVLAKATLLLLALVTAATGFRLVCIQTGADRSPSTEVITKRHAGRRWFS